MKNLLVFLIIMLSLLILTSMCKQIKDPVDFMTTTPPPAEVKDQKPEAANVELVNSKIEFNELTFEVPKLYEGEELKHTFEFKNTGDEVLKIVSVKAG